MKEISHLRWISWGGLGAVLFVVIFVPIIPRQVVPEWRIQFVSVDAAPVGSVEVDQLWKDYSLEYWTVAENADRNLLSDPNGYISLPSREIRVSIFQLATSLIRDAVMSVNPHASFGPSSYIVCRKENSCLASFKGDGAVQTVVVR
jgi:hypothetical protein